MDLVKTNRNENRRMGSYDIEIKNANLLAQGDRDRRILQLRQQQMLSQAEINSIVPLIRELKVVQIYCNDDISAVMVYRQSHNFNAVLDFPAIGGKKAYIKNLKTFAAAHKFKLADGEIRKENRREKNPVVDENLGHDRRRGH